MVANEPRRQNRQHARGSKAVVGNAKPYVFKRLTERRLLSEEIAAQNAAATCGLLLLLDAENKQEDISLCISSAGGGINAGLSDMQHHAID